MSNNSEEKKAALMAALFDLRSVIATLFLVYGVVLTILGLMGETEAELAKAGGIALNLWTGIVMLGVGLIFAAWVYFKPPVQPSPSDLEEGGPLHGHGH